MGDASRDRHPHRVVEQRFAGAGTGIAGLGPGLAATAAGRTCPAHRHVERHDQAAARLQRGEPQLGGQNVGGGTLAEKRFPNALDDMPDRGKVDGDLVRKAVPRDAGPAQGLPFDGRRIVTKRFAAHDEPANDRSGSRACQGAARMLASRQHFHHENKNHARDEGVSGLRRNDAAQRG
jgi:hypothetical protein